MPQDYRHPTRFKTKFSVFVQIKNVLKLKVETVSVGFETETEWMWKKASIASHQFLISYRPSGVSYHFCKS